MTTKLDLQVYRIKDLRSVSMFCTMLNLVFRYAHVLR